MIDNTEAMIFLSWSIVLIQVYYGMQKTAEENYISECTDKKLATLEIKNLTTV